VRAFASHQLPDALGLERFDNLRLRLLESERLGLGDREQMQNVERVGCLNRVAEWFLLGQLESVLRELRVGSELRIGRRGRKLARGGESAVKLDRELSEIR